MTYRIRLMRKEDLPQVNAIDREAFPEQWPAANYRHEMENIMAHYVVAYDDNRVQAEKAKTDGNGWLNKIGRLFNLSDPAEPPPGEKQHVIGGFAGFWMMADEAHITNIAVRRSQRRRGVGELLMVALFDLAAEMKARLVTLEVRASNAAARKLYEGMGFERVGIRHGYYSDLSGREDAVIMTTGQLDSPAFQERLAGLKQGLARKLGGASLQLVR